MPLCALTCMTCCLVCTANSKCCYAGELLASVIVLEAALKAHEHVLGPKDALVRTALRRADNLLSALSAEERRQVCLSLSVTHCVCLLCFAASSLLRREAARSCGRRRCHITEFRI